MDRLTNNWMPWNHFLESVSNKDRIPLMRVVRYERRASPSPETMDQQEGIGLTVNVSSGGLCVLLEFAPEVGEILRLHMPMPVTEAHTPTLADVRWVQRLPFDGNQLAVVGLKFLI